MFLTKKSNNNLEAIFSSEVLRSLASILDKTSQENTTTIELASVLPYINKNLFNSFLEEIDWVVNQRGYWIVAKEALDNGYLYNMNNNRMPFVTEKGAKVLIRFYINGDLPLKKNKKDE